MASVSFEQATRRYPGTDRPALDRLDLIVGDGEFVVLVGPSGCGKTTSLRMVAGLETLDCGRIRIGERDVTEVDPKDRDVAMVFQNYALYPHMTVAQNMGFALKVAKIGKAEIRERVLAAAKLLDLQSYLDRKPKDLSGGQRQRVAMGRAIVRRPQVFLMDEPLSNLDAKLRGQTRNQIAALQRQLGTTTVYVTHDQVEAMTMGDRVAVLSDGVLQQCASPRELYRNPGNVFVAGFIGSPAMNLFRLSIADSTVSLGDWQILLPRAARHPGKSVTGIGQRVHRSNQPYPPDPAAFTHQVDACCAHQRHVSPESDARRRRRSAGVPVWDIAARDYPARAGRGRPLERRLTGPFRSRPTRFGHTSRRPLQVLRPCRRPSRCRRRPAPNVRGEHR